MHDSLTLCLARVDDWQCLYVNGEAFSQGHTLNWTYMLETLTKRGPIIGFASFSVRPVLVDGEDEALEPWGYQFPESLAEIPKEVRVGEAPHA